jgi:hypothetical protein
MAIPNRTKMQRYFAELQRLEETRSMGAEKEIQKAYKAMLKDLRQFLGEEYGKYAVDDALTYSTLAQKGQYARFLEEVQKKVNGITPRVNSAITNVVKETYKMAYEGMVQAVAVAVNDKQLEQLLSGIHLTEAEVIKAAVNNPVSKLTLSKTLEKNRKQIVHNIKQTVTVGIMNGDRMSTMAKKIQADVDQNYRKAMLIARTEVHRVRETGHNDGAASVDNILAEENYDYRMVKVWKSMRDASVRKTSKADHRKMNGQTVLQDEDFKLGRGVTAPCPGQSGTAYNDCNCRCYVSHDLMSDSEFFQATGRHFKEVEKPKGSETETKINHEPPTPELEQKRKAVAAHFKQLGAEVDDDGMVTLYHATDKANVPKIKKNGFKPTNAPINGGTGGEEVKERVFFGYDKEWISDTWSNSGNYEIMKVKIPAEYLHQAGANTKEVFVEGTIKMGSDGIWIPDILPTSTAWDRKTVKRWLKKNQIAVEPEKVKVSASNFPDSFNQRTAKKQTQKFVDYVNSIDGADRDMISIYDSIGKMENIERNGIPFKITYGKSGHAVGMRWNGLTGNLAEVKVKIPKLDAENITGAAQTTAHELGHYIDLLMRTDASKHDGWISTTKGMSNAIDFSRRGISDEVSELFKESNKLIEDIRKRITAETDEAVKKLRADNLDVISEMYSNYTAYKEYRKKVKKLYDEAEDRIDYETRNQLRGVNSLQDIYDALSKGKYRGDGTVKYGHGSRYYASMENQIQEIWANYCALSLTRPDLIDMLRRDKPDLVAALDEIKAEILKKVGRM